MPQENVERNEGEKLYGVHAVLTKLHGVKQTAPDRWVARCPAHADKHPSLAIKETEDQRVLMHCFSGCSIEEITAALDIDLSDLFPQGERFVDNIKGERWPFAVKMLHTLCEEITVVVIYAADIRAGEIPSHEDHARFLLACTRINAADGGFRHATR